MNPTSYFRIRIFFGYFKYVSTRYLTALYVRRLDRGRNSALAKYLYKDDAKGNDSVGSDKIIFQMHTMMCNTLIFWVNFVAKSGKQYTG